MTGSADGDAKLKILVGGNITPTTNEVRSGKIVIGGIEYSVALIRSHKAPEGNFLVANVRVGGKAIWSFKDEKFDGIAVLIKIEGEHFICFVSRDKQLKRLIPLEDIANSRDGKYIFSEELKKFAMKELGIVPVFDAMRIKVK